MNAPKTITAPVSVGVGQTLRDHLVDHARTMDALELELTTLTGWGGDLATRLWQGSRLLVAGNGGSAAEAQHLTAEIVGRFDGERRPFSAISLPAETSSVTAIANDYGYDEVFARQVAAHARRGDVVILFTTSGRSPNLIAAARAARRMGATTWAITGSAPNPLCDECDAHVALPGTGAAVQEAQLVALHLLCRVFDSEVRRLDALGGAVVGEGGMP
jgi:D-sedoheptulose 7-phosphate isomerase